MEKQKKGSGREFLSKNRSVAAGVIGCLAVAVVIGYCVFWSYSQYRRELIATEQEQLLTMAETTGTSLVNFVEQEMDNLELYFSSMELNVQSGEISSMQQAAERFFESGDGLYQAMACYNGDGALLYQYGSMGFSYNQIPETSEASICGKRLVQGHYEMYLSKRFTWNQEPYTVLYAMNLDELYRRIVQPIQIGAGGYSIVKDSALSIIMHHAPGQIGMDAVYDRQKVYPQLDLTDLFQWLQLQQTQPTGVGIINSYRWDDPELTPERRIVASTSIYLPGETWIVNSTLPFRELNGPLNRMLFRLLGISGIFFTFAVLAVFVLTRSRVRSEGQKREIEYLRQINEGMELLYRKEEEMQHYQRLQSIGQMSSHIAHEFNNYLTPVLLYGEMLEHDECLGGENQELVKGILNAAGQAAELSRKLLDFSRHDTGTRLKVIDLTQEMEQAVHMLRQLTPAKIAFATELMSEPVYVRGNEGMMEHILMNLCNNAYHAMEGTEGSLIIRMGLTEAIPGKPAGEPSEQAENYVCVSVSDTGCGISQEVKDKIFEPFYTTKRSGKGTGLGLSVIRNLMVAAGGEIRVESQPGQGSTFFLYFPLTAVGTEPEKSRELSGTGRVLVVDDEEDVRKALELSIRQRGRKVETFSHPAVALSRLQNHPDYCEVILTDYSMPSMNGLEFAAVVRQLNPKIRLILISGQEDPQFEWYLNHDIIDAFILKSELAKELDSVL